MTDISLQVKNYTGSNSFIIKMKDAISKYGSLTVNQKSAVEKIFKKIEEVKNVEFTPEMKEILSYDGPSTFVNDLKSKLNLYGKLSEKQIQAGLNQIQKEKNQKETIHMNIPVEGDSIKVGRVVGQKLKDTYGLKFNPTILDITKVLAVSPKAVKFSGKMTIKRGDVCLCCAKTLTDEFSMLTKMGKTCAKHMGVEYITDKSQADRFREEYLKRVEEIGEMEFWVPKSKIVKWEGDNDILLQMF
jgi:hypothetical protein